MVSPYITPLSYAREIDLSLYTPAFSTTIFSIVTTASWGPVNTRTLITDEGNQNLTFGPQGPTHMGLYAGARYLRNGNQLYVVRVATYDQKSTGELRNAGDTADAINIEAVYTGSFGDQIEVFVNAGSSLGSYKLTIEVSGTVVEMFDNVVLTPTTSSNFVETRVNGISEWIAVAVQGAETTLLTSVSVALTGGDDGAPADSSDIIGTIVGDTATGLQLFRDRQLFLTSMIAAPGMWAQEVLVELASIAAERGDCIAILDPPDHNLTSQEMTDWWNGTLTGDPDYLEAAIDTSFACTYYPYLKIYDSFSDQELFIPPSGHAANRMAFTDYTFDPWYAPMGPKRGILIDALDVQTELRLGAMDLLYSNNINPIAKIAGATFTSGIMINGQKTAQRLPTALDRINVRRMLNVAKPSILAALRGFVGDPNDIITYIQVQNICEPVWRAIQGRRGIVDFRVICDETTNTVDVVERNEVRVKNLIKPTKTAEIILADLIILPQAARFEEFVQA